MTFRELINTNILDFDILLFAVSILALVAFSLLMFLFYLVIIKFKDEL